MHTNRADEIKINVEIAVDILNNLLLYEKQDGGLMLLEKREYPGVMLVYDVFKSFAIQARAKYESLHNIIPLNIFLRLKLSLYYRWSDIQVEFECDQKTIGLADEELSQPTIYVHVDKAKISQVIRNLLSNALKFSQPKSSIKIRVVLCRCDTPNSHFRVEVEDFGVGMLPHEVKRLFEEMIQFDPSTLQAGLRYRVWLILHLTYFVSSITIWLGGGSGLGLYISKGIVDLHDGEIGVPLFW